MKKTYTQCCVRNRSRREGGYIALGLVSVISLVMLVVSISIAGQVVGVAVDVGGFESFHAARTVALSCVSIVREKLIEVSFENGETSVTWQLQSLEQGSCQVEMSETPFGFDVHIIGYADTGTEVAMTLSASIEKQTGRIRALLFL